MSGIHAEINKQIQDIIDLAIKNGEMTKAKYKKNIKHLQKKRPELEIQHINKRILRHYGLNNLMIFANMLGFDVYSNPIYKEICVTLEKTEKKIICLFLPRGTWKSVLFGSGVALWEYLRKTIQLGQAPAIYMAHGDIGKAQENLIQVSHHIKNAVIQEIYGDVLSFVTDNKSELRFEDNSPIKRKEPHFSTGSVETDETGEHFGLFFLDDWVTETNTANHEMNKKNKVAFRRLFSLDDHSGIFRIFMVGTAYGDNSLYEDLRENPDVEFIEYKAYVDKIVDGKMVRTYNFLAQNLTEEKLEMYKRQIGNRLFNSQYLMIPYSIDGVDTLVKDRSFLFAYKDDDFVPEGVQRIKYTKAQLMKQGAIVTSKDPSYSTQNKVWDDKKSKSCTSTSVLAIDGKTYVIGEHKALGEEFNSMYESLRDEIVRFNADVAVQDSQGTQENYARKFKEMLKNEQIPLRYFHFYKKAPVVGVKGKMQRAFAMLGELLVNKQMMVHWSCVNITKEIMRETRGFDFLDTLQQTLSLNSQYWATYCYNIKKSELKKKNINNRYKNIEKKTMFRRTGY